MTVGPAVEVVAVRAAVRAALRGLKPAQPIFVACSGGADSLALAAATAFEVGREVREGRGARLMGLVTVDHALQHGSAQQAARVAQLGYDLGFDPVLTIPVQVGAEGGPEAAARDARYAALAALAQTHTAMILLGHTLDDQAETVLLGLGRGSGPRSIAGMRPQNGPYLRPLLGIRRQTTQDLCADLGLPVWNDPQNDDPSFQRVRLRRLLPELDAALQGGVPEALARTAALLQDDLDALDELAAAQVPTDSEDTLDVARLAALPRALRTRVFRAWASPHTGMLTAKHLHALDALITDWHGQGPIVLPRAVTVARRSGRIRLEAPRPRE